MEKMLEITSGNKFWKEFSCKNRFEAERHYVTVSNCATDTFGVKYFRTVAYVQDATFLKTTVFLELTIFLIF